MFAIALALALLFPVSQLLVGQKSDLASSQAPAQKDPVWQQRMDEAREKYEPHRQAALRINELAQAIRSEDDARALVDAVAEELTGHRHLPWTTIGIRHRVARAEFVAASDPARLIPEQRVADVWNEYVREIDAPEEALVTVNEIHHVREAMLESSRRTWDVTPFPSIWIAPAVHAVDADGKLADGCRALEALKVIYSLYFEFPTVLSARLKAGAGQGILITEEVSAPDVSPQAASLKGGGKRTYFANPFPAQAPDRQYFQNHGRHDYNRLRLRLLKELFPDEQGE